MLFPCVLGMEQQPGKQSYVFARLLLRPVLAAGSARFKHRAPLCMHAREHPPGQAQVATHCGTRHMSCKPTE